MNETLVDAGGDGQHISLLSSACLEHMQLSFARRLPASCSSLHHKLDLTSSQEIARTSYLARWRIQNRSGGLARS